MGDFKGIFEEVYGYIGFVCFFNVWFGSGKVVLFDYEIMSVLVVYFSKVENFIILYFWVKC